jgi:hypothetical protein
MSEATEYVANALLRVNRPRDVFIETYFYQKESLANIQFTIQIHPERSCLTGYMAMKSRLCSTAD